MEWLRTTKHITNHFRLMNINTKDGGFLIASLGRYTSKTEKIIFFKTRAGSLVSSYYVSTFNSIKEGDGLMLSNSCDPDQVIDGDEVAKCKTLFATTHDVPLPTKTRARNYQA